MYLLAQLLMISRFYVGVLGLLSIYHIVDFAVAYMCVLVFAKYYFIFLSTFSLLLLSVDSLSTIADNLRNKDNNN